MWWTGWLHRVGLENQGGSRWQTTGSIRSLSSHHLHGEILHSINNASIDGKKAISSEHSRFVIGRCDHGFNRDEMVCGKDLAAINPFVWLLMATASKRPSEWPQRSKATYLSN